MKNNWYTFSYQFTGMTWITVLEGLGITPIWTLKYYIYHTWCMCVILMAEIPNTGVMWNAPISMWKMVLSCDNNCIIIWNAPIIEEFHFRFFFCFKIDYVLLLYVINFTTENESKMKLFDFGAFQKIMKMLNRGPLWTVHMTKCSFTCFLGHFMSSPYHVESFLYVNFLIKWVEGQFCSTEKRTYASVL